MIKSVFFPILASRISAGGLEVACQVAREHDAHVVAAVCVNVVNPLAGSWAYYPMAIYADIDHETKAVSGRLKEEAAALLAESGVSHEVHVSEAMWLTAGEAAAIHARYHDLTVFARVDGFDARLEAECFADLLLQSGRPLLLVPEGAAGPVGGNALIAWKPTREATRALHDALPLLAGSPLVRIVAIDPKVSHDAYGELPGSDMAASLARHGLRVEVVQCPGTDAGTGDSLLAQAREFGAGLVVAGGYGHHRARQRVFGGVTRTLFEHATMPVLFSH